MSQNITQQVHVVQRSEIGLKRTVNQDSIGVRVPKAGEASQHALFVVADGVGGNLPKGEVASRTAVEAVFAYYYAEPDSSDILTRVGDALQDTNIAVRDQAMAEGVNAIGTTIVGLALAPSGEAIAFNVGDSRLYRIRNREIELISEDQVSSPEPGVLKDEFKARRVTKISSYIGQPNLLEPNFYRLKTQPGDIYLLCSDGVWSKFQDEELLQLIDQQSLEPASEQIVKLVYERGAPDNLSLILVQLEAPKARAAAEPIGEMPTAITSKPAASSGGRSLTPFIIAIVVVAVIIAAIVLLNNQSSSTTPTPTTVALAASSATVEANKTAVTEAPTNTPKPKPSSTQTAAPTTAAAFIIQPTDTAEPKPSATPVPPSATATHTATLPPTPTASHTSTVTASVTASPTATATHTPTVAPTRTYTSTPTPTEEPTVEALVATDIPTIEPRPTDKPSATPTESSSDTPTPRPTQPPPTIPATTTINPTLITYTPTPRPTATATPTVTATPTDTNTPTATATATSTPTATPTLTATPSNTPNAQEAAQTATAKASITPTVAPTLYKPQDNAVITLTKPIKFYPSADSASFSLPDSGGVELPDGTVVKVVSSQPTPIDGLIYSYVTLQSSVAGVTEQSGWATLAGATQATVTAHLQGGVAIRRGPSQLYERIGTGLRDGESAVIIGQATYHKQLWFYVDPVNPQTTSGWIYSGVKGLEVDGSISDIPQHFYPAEPTLTPTPIPTSTETPLP